MESPGTRGAVEAVCDLESYDVQHNGAVLNDRSCPEGARPFSKIRFHAPNASDDETA